MKPIAHIEVIRAALDAMADEHPLERMCWPIYNDLLEHLEKLEHEMNRMDVVKETNDANGNKPRSSG